MACPVKEIQTKRRTSIAWVRPHCRAVMGTGTVPEAPKGYAARWPVPDSEMAWQLLRRAVVESAAWYRAAASPMRPSRTIRPRRKQQRAIRRRQWLTFWTSRVRYTLRKGVVLDLRAM